MAVGVLAATAVVPTDVASATPAAGTVSSYVNGLSANAGLKGIVTGPDGNLWFTEFNANKIGQMTPTGQITEYSLTAGANPMSIAPGPDGNLWFTELNADKVGKITPTGQITEYSAGITAGGLPYGITPGPDGNLWFTEFTADKIGKITPAGQITEYSTGITSGAGVKGIVAGPDGNLWFTEANVDKIGKITPSGSVTEYALNTGAAPDTITVGSDGNLWFTQSGLDAIGKITTGGTITGYNAGITSGSSPAGITAGTDSELWFAGSQGSLIGATDMSGNTTEHPLPAVGAQPVGITSGPDGNFWFTQSQPDAVGVITSGVSGPTVAAQPTSANVSATVYPRNQTATALVQCAKNTSFTVGITSDQSPTGSPASGAAAASIGGTCGGLDPGIAYYARVRLVYSLSGNALGYGYTPTTLFTTPATTPGAPTNASATARYESAAVSWQPPSSNGGSAITGYTATANPGGASCTVSASEGSCVVEGLANGTSYTFTVTATNTVGTGPASSPSSPVTPASTVPDAPTNVTAVVGNRQAIVSWMAPSYTGGPPVSQYTASASPGSASCVSSTTSCTISGLTNGTSYTFSVSATNSVGASILSASSAVVTPVASVLTFVNTPSQFVKGRKQKVSLSLGSGASLTGTATVRIKGHRFCVASIVAGTGFCHGMVEKFGNLKLRASFVAADEVDGDPVVAIKRISSRTVAVRKIELEAHKRRLIATIKGIGGTVGLPVALQVKYRHSAALLLGLGVVSKGGSWKLEAEVKHSKISVRADDGVSKSAWFPARKGN